MIKKLFTFGGSLNTKEHTIAGVIGGICLFALWWLVTALELIPTKIFPNPLDVLASFPTLLGKSDLIGNMFFTVELNLLGYLVALLVAIPLGFLIGIYPAGQAMFQKPLEASRFIPLPAITGIFVAGLGLGFDMKATFMAVSILIYILPTLVQNVANLQDPANQKDNVYLQTAKTLGMGKWQMFKYVYWPYTMSRSYGSIRELTAISYTYVTIAEGINRVGGLGAMINIFTRQSRMPEVYALLFVIIMIGILQDTLLKKLEPILFPFKK